MNCVDCNAPIPAKRKRCEPCRIAAEKACTERHNAKQKAQKAAYRALNPYRCRHYCGAVVTSKNMVCQACKDSVAARQKQMKREQEARYKAAKKELAAKEEAVYIVPAKPEHRKPTKIVKTSAQVDRECRAEEKRLTEVRERLNPALLAARNAPSWMVKIISLQV